MLMKLIAYLLIVAAVCSVIGGMTEVAIFSTFGTIGFCGAGIVFLVWVFRKIFFKND